MWGSEARRVFADDGGNRGRSWHVAQAGGRRGVHRFRRVGCEQAAIVSRKLYLAAAWAALSAIVVLTVVPPNFRPTTDAPHDVEHAAAFFITGVLFGLAYAGRERILSVGAVAFCAMIEVLQLYVPGRHARWIDFAVDALAAVFGILVGAFGGRTLLKRRP
jgi:VanZ family protein